MILRNHGTLAVGATRRRMLHQPLLSSNAPARRRSWRCRPGRDGLYNPPQGTPEKAAGQGKAGLGLVANKLAWPALLRKLDRIDPSFRD